jgi:hypothetical protein
LNFNLSFCILTFAFLSELGFGYSNFGFGIWTLSYVVLYRLAGCKFRLSPDRACAMMLVAVIGGGS